MSGSNRKGPDGGGQRKGRGSGAISPVRGRRRRRRGGGGGGRGSKVVNQSAQVPGGSGHAQLSGTGALRPGGVKVVVRLLPPSLTEESFFRAVKESGSFTTEWHNFVPGNTGKRAASGSQSGAHGFQHARCYMSFSNMDLAVAFSGAFNGHRFVEAKNGFEYIARVERSLLQRVPSARRREKNKLEGTITSDPDFQEFLASWEAEGKGSKPSTSRFDGGGASGSASKGKGDELIVTPLMAELRARRRERDGKKAASRSYRQRSTPAGGSTAPPEKAKARAAARSADAPEPVADTARSSSDKMTILTRTKNEAPNHSAPPPGPSEKKRSSRRKRSKRTGAEGTTRDPPSTVTKPKNNTGVTTPRILKPSKGGSKFSSAQPEQLWVAKPTKKS